MKVQNITFAGKPIVFANVGEITANENGVFDIPDETVANSLTKIGFTIVEEKEIPAPKTEGGVGNQKSKAVSKTTNSGIDDSKTEVVAKESGSEDNKAESTGEESAKEVTKKEE